VVIEESARKHGIEDADILHAIRNPLRYLEQEYGGESRRLVLGADRAGSCWRSWWCRCMSRSG